MNMYDSYQILLLLLLSVQNLVIWNINLFFSYTVYKADIASFGLEAVLLLVISLGPAILNPQSCGFCSVFHNFMILSE